MKRLDVLKRLGLGALAIPLASSPALVAVEDDESYQFGTIVEDVGRPLAGASRVFRGKPSFDAMKQAVSHGFNYCWRYVMRDGVRHSEGMEIR